MKPDLIVSWPDSIDYPLWREMIRNDRHRFAKVIVVFTKTNYGNDITQFVRESMELDDIKFIDSPKVENGQDWRDVAVNAALLISHSEWVYFTEQDFFPNELLWQQVGHALSTNAQAMGVLVGSRLHPCCLIIKRKTLDLLNKTFGIVPDRLDHFGLIQKQMEDRKIPTAILNENFYHHMAGLSHNMRLILDGQEPNHDRADFVEYMRKCLNVTVPLMREYRILFESCLKSIS